jgi:hypothetical protein
MLTGIYPENYSKKEIISTKNGKFNYNCGIKIKKGEATWINI